MHTLGHGSGQQRTENCGFPAKNFTEQDISPEMREMIDRRARRL